MSVIRSPQNTIVGDGSQSQPDLSKISGGLIDSQITKRKRKQPASSDCDCSGEIKLVRNDLTHITSLLENYVHTI